MTDSSDHSWDHRSDHGPSGQLPATRARPSDPRVHNALVVDGSDGARRRVRTVLRLGGWRVHEASGTVDALRQAATLDLDLVVADMTLPDGDGAALLRRLRADGGSVFLIAVSTEGTAQVRARAAAAGADGCLVKPVDPRQLVQLLLRRADDPAHERPGGEDGRPPLRVSAERVDQDRAARVNGPPDRIDGAHRGIAALPARPQAATSR